MTTTAHGVEEVRALPRGEVLGTSGTHRVTQEAVDAFAAATGDRAGSTGGGPVAQGFLVLSLVPVLMPQVVQLTGFSLVVNYGCEQVRFPAPAPVGSEVRATAVLDDVVDVPGGLQVTLTMTITVVGAAEPACVVTTVTRQLV